MCFLQRREPVAPAAQSPMPPRRSGRVAAAAEQQSCAFPQLPPPLVLRIFALLPADQRLRCAEVCRGWRATVAQPALWARLDLSPGSGVARYSRGLLRAALARAAGALTALHVCWTSGDAVALCSALRASRALTELHLESEYTTAADIVDAHTVTFVTALLAGLPQLRELHAAVDGSFDEAVRLLHGRPPPLARLRVRDLALWQDGAPLPPALARALADARLQPSLARLSLFCEDLQAPGLMDALADAVVARRRRLSSLTFVAAALTAAEAPAVARMLRDGALAELAFVDTRGPLFGGAAQPALADALRGCTTLTSLALSNTPLPALLMTALLGALVGHASLRTLDLGRSVPENRAALGAALAALLAADAPALRELNLRMCELGRAGLGPLCYALPFNSHLRTLDALFTRMPAGFRRSRLLPAVRANTSLRTLCVDFPARGDDAAAAQEALRIVAARWR